MNNGKNFKFGKYGGKNGFIITVNINELKSMKQEIKGEITFMKQNIRGKMASMKQEMKSDLKSMN